MGDLWADSGWPSPQVQTDWAQLGSRERKRLKTPSGVMKRTASIGSECLVPGGIQVEAGWAEERLLWSGFLGTRGHDVPLLFIL